MSKRQAKQSQEAREAKRVDLQSRIDSLFFKRQMKGDTSGKIMREIETLEKERDSL